MAFDQLDESDILEAERRIGRCPRPTGRLKLICKGTEERLYQLWETVGVPKRGIWLPVPKVMLDQNEDWP